MYRNGLIGQQTDKQTNRKKESRSHSFQWKSVSHFVFHFCLTKRKEKRLKRFSLQERLCLDTFFIFFLPLDSFIHSFNAVFDFRVLFFFCFVFVFSFNHNDWFQIKLNWKKIDSFIYETIIIILSCCDYYGNL